MKKLTMDNFEPSFGPLNRLLSIERYSLANYLLYALPWVHRGNEPLMQTIHHTAADQQYYAQRIDAMLVDRDGWVEGGSFPMRFTAFNDLSLDYLAERLVECQRRTVAEIERCVQELVGDELAQQLAKETLGGGEGPSRYDA